MHIGGVHLAVGNIPAEAELARAREEGGKELPCPHPHPSKYLLPSTKSMPLAKCALLGGLHHTAWRMSVFVERGVKDTSS